MRAAIGHHLQQAAAAVLVLGVLAQMRGEFFDFLRKERDLDLGAAGVRVVDCAFFDCLFFLPLSQHEHIVAHADILRKPLIRGCSFYVRVVF
jgi:hypothetical protein